MLTPSKKVFYSVEAVLYIAYNTAQGPISSKEIAEQQGLPPRYLEQIMQRLVRAGILRGVRGPRGGYLLARERRRITVGDICAVLREDKDEQEDMPCTPLGRLIMQPVWERAGSAAMEQLNQVSIAELCEQAGTRQIRKSGEDKPDFTI